MAVVQGVARELEQRQGGGRGSAQRRRGAAMLLAMGKVLGLLQQDRRRPISSAAGRPATTLTDEQIEELHRRAPRGAGGQEFRANPTGSATLLTRRRDRPRGQARRDFRMAPA